MTSTTINHTSASRPFARRALSGAAALVAVGSLGMGAANAAGPAGSSEATGARGGLPNCSSQDLKTDVALDDSVPAEGHTTMEVSFQNVTGETCKLVGHPKIEAVGEGDGTTLGNMSQDKGPEGDVTVLNPNDRTVAEFQVGNLGFLDDDQTEPMDGWRIYPPNSDTADYVEDKGEYAPISGSNVDWLAVKSVQPVG